MKVVAIILILTGIGVFICQAIRGTQKEKVIDIGRVEISRQVERSDSRQLYVTGGLAVVAVLILASKRKVAA